ncbi:c-type cytochrome [Halioxenophilus aromaticivorans]|uniref:Cytochrome c n=1 Tax=Halioxenophilus aromaticivorans TaxID=1306992 RepID=A0AAV3U1D4_9ALTE
MKKLTMAAAALVFASSVATAHTDEKDPVKAQIQYRKAVFSLVGAHMGKMGAVMKGEAKYNAETISQSANVLAALAPVASQGFEIESLGHGSEAKAAIWKDKKAFDEKMADFVAATAKLAASAGTEKGFKSNFGAVGKTCKGCHDDFKE